MESGIRSRESLVSELLFEALRVKNDRLNTLATEVFAVLGPLCRGSLTPRSHEKGELSRLPPSPPPYR